MTDWLSQDTEALPALLQDAKEQAVQYLTQRQGRFTAPRYAEGPARSLPEEGIGARAAMELFCDQYEPYLQNSTGPRFFGYVIGGNTPAALMGDWLCSAYDQNAFALPDTADRQIEREVSAFLRELLELPASFEGVFCSGATMANFTALAIARAWACERQGLGADDGLFGAKAPYFITGQAHPSVYKALSMLGIGRRNMIRMPLLPGREAVDPDAVEAFLKAHTDRPVILIANAGTVNSGDLDDIAALADLKDRYGCYLHIEGAIGAVAAASPKLRGLFSGAQQADSFTVDAHKWLNTPYDGAMVLVRGEDNRRRQYGVFAQALSGEEGFDPKTAYYNLAPEGSRRFRALPAWLSLMAYGKSGYCQLVERNCDLAQLMASLLGSCPALRLVCPVRLNIAAFTLSEQASPERVEALAAAIRRRGVTFVNTAVLLGAPVIRVCISSYLTREEDVRAAAHSILAAVQELEQTP